MQLDELLDKLNLSDKDGLFCYDDLDCEKVNFLSIRVKDTLKEYLKPDAFFCVGNEPLILFFENERDLEKLEKQIWSFNQSPIIFIKENSQWIIKNGFKFLKEDKSLATLTNDTKYINIFEYFQLLSGKTWERYKEDFNQKNRVDYYLLDNIEGVRSVLIKKGNLHSKIANSIIGRVIFIRYLIDRKVELGEKYNIKDKEDFYRLLTDKQNTYSFFQQIKEDFNGNLFPLEYEIDGEQINEKDRVNDNHLKYIINLLKGDSIQEDSSVQLSFFDVYDFSIIPIEFVSNVYEKFIGVDKQAASGAYYTPLFLVDYIQKETVSNFFLQNAKEYNCKVLDPACGSGIFLVETLRQIIAQYKFNSGDEKEDEYKEKLATLLKDNIFGIDKDENAITVAIFSLYITLLDNLNPKSIVGFRFPELIGTNFFVSDFFETEHEFNKILKKHHFQFILGNPPWATKHPSEKQLFEKYIQNRNKVEESKLEIVHREIAESFLVRVSDFDFEETAFVVASKILYKIESDGVFRKFFVNNFSIRQVVEMSSVRHQIFHKKAVAPASILFYKRETDNEILKTNIVKHISLKPNIFFETFKILVIEKYDVKEISQKYFIEEDWIWKVLVYGNILDYYFIKRLKNNFKNIGQITSDESKFIKGQGLKFKDGERKINTEKFKDYSFIGSLKKNINHKEKKETTKYDNYLKPYYLKTGLENWDCRDVGYFPNDFRIFEPPSLLIPGGVSNKFKSVSGIMYYTALFRSSLTAIKALEEKDVLVLKAICSILNSSYFSYYILNHCSSVGIEREEIHDKEKWNVPFVTSHKLVSLVTETEKLSKKHYESDFEGEIIKNQLETTINNIDEEIIHLFKTSNQEKSLIDYTNTIIIPLLKENKKENQKVIRQIKNKDSILNDYAQIFIDHFSKRFNKEGSYFEVEILWSKYVILMKFNINPEPSKHKDCIIWNEIEDKQLLINLTKLGFENLSDDLFLQKDVKGFEEDYFYVAKPNQYKSWHPALAHLDLSEFIEAFYKIYRGENVE